MFSPPLFILRAETLERQDPRPPNTQTIHPRVAAIASRPYGSAKALAPIRLLRYQRTVPHKASEAQDYHLYLYPRCVSTFWIQLPQEWKTTRYTSYRSVVIQIGMGRSKRFGMGIRCRASYRPAWNKGSIYVYFVEIFFSFLQEWGSIE